MCACQNKCKDLPSYVGGHRRYQDGYRKCKTCEKAYKTNDTRCFCCNRKLRWSGLVPSKSNPKNIY